MLSDPMPNETTKGPFWLTISRAASHPYLKVQAKNKVKMAFDEYGLCDAGQLFGSY